MKIKLSEPDGPYSCEIDTEVMEVEIREAFIGALFVTAEGVRLGVMMRDDFFEFTVNGKPWNPERPDVQ